MTLTIYRGEKKTWTCTVTSGGTALDLTGATIRFAVRDAYPPSSIIADGDALISKSTASGITITNEAGGIFTLTLLKADTNTLACGDYQYGIEYENASGGPFVIDQGTFTIDPDIVRT